MKWDDDDEAAMLHAEGARAQADAEAANAEAESSGVFAIQKLADHNVELALQLGIMVEWAEGFSVKYCRCVNNGDYCEFHEMLAQAKEALK